MSAEAAAPSKPAGSMFLKVLLVVIALVAAFLGFMASQPNDFHVERTTKIAAPPEVVFEQISDFHKWDDWSPWAKLDPAAKNTFEGPDSGVGAKFSWAGNDQVGEGSMTITDSQPHSSLKIKLDFEKPMKDTSTVGFDLKPSGAETSVTWSMSGQYQGLVGKTICYFMNMDKMIGDKYEEGLRNLKKISEAKP